jgi:hypothetical protein
VSYVPAEGHYLPSGSRFLASLLNAEASRLEIARLQPHVLLGDFEKINDDPILRR